MFEKILVPLDGSAAAETALPLVEALRAAFGSTLTLIHLPETSGPAEAHGERHLAGGSEAREYLAGLAARVFPGGAKVEIHVHDEGTDDLPRSLAEHAAELCQDLVVLCVHGRGGLERLFEGSLGQRIMRHQTAPVLLLRSGEVPERPFGRILLALDGKPEHEQSLPLVRELAAALGAAVDLARVVPSSFALKDGGRAAGLLSPSAMREALRLEEERTDAYLAAKAVQLAAAGIPAASYRRRGEPARQLARLARELGSGLVVLGTHGKAGARAFWAESAAARIVSALGIPALLVPSDKGYCA